jgi:hypothetical protein
VEITARSGLTLYTPASSIVSNPTSRFGHLFVSRPFNMPDRTAGLILAAQPHVRAMPVKLFFQENIFIVR